MKKITVVLIIADLRSRFFTFDMSAASRKLCEKIGDILD